MVEAYMSDIDLATTLSVPFFEVGDRIMSKSAEEGWEPRPLRYGDLGTVLEVRPKDQVLVVFDGDPPMQGTMNTTNIALLQGPPPLPPPSTQPPRGATFPQSATLTMDPFAGAQAIEAGTILGSIRRAYTREQWIQIYSSTRSGQVIDTIRVPALGASCNYVRARGPTEIIDALPAQREMVPIDKPTDGAIDLNDFRAVTSGAIFELCGTADLQVFASASSDEFSETRRPGQHVVAAGRPQREAGYTMLPIRPSGFIEMQFCQMVEEQEAIADLTVLRCVRDWDVVQQSGMRTVERSLTVGMRTVERAVKVRALQELVAAGRREIWNDGSVMVPIKEPAGYLPLHVVQVKQLLLPTSEDLGESGPLLGSYLEETVPAGQRAPQPSPSCPGEYSKSAKPQGEPAELPETTVAIMMVAPWVMFTALAFSATMWSEEFQWMTWLILIVAVVVALHFMNHSRRGYLITGSMCLVSIVAGDMWGILVHKHYMDEYWRLNHGASHTNVIASGKGVVAFPDASTLDFQTGTFVDTSRTLGYMEFGEVYCVAPVTGEAFSASPVYYAVGKNCCNQRDNFKCGKTGLTSGSNTMKALVITEDIGKYQTAIRMMGSVYGMTTRGQNRIFVNFLEDVTGYQGNLVVSAFTYASAGCLIWAIGCIGVGIFSKDIFFKDRIRVEFYSPASTRDRLLGQV